MPPNRLLTITGISLLLLSLLAPVAAAQTAPTTVHITDVVGPVEIQGPGNLPALSLQADFTMLDATGQVVRGVQIETVSMVLADGSEFPAQLEDIATPWSIVVLVDSSKTMAAFSAAA